MKPITLPIELLASICAAFVKLGVLRADNSLLHHALVERGQGRVILAATDFSSALIYCHLPVPLPLTELQGKLAAVQWRAEAMRFLVPIADLREAARKAQGLITILPGELRSGPLPLARFTAPDVNDFPRVLPLLDSIRVGWTSRIIHTGRVDPSALAEED
ncbi:MAG: hypothetical protein QOE70_899 [Chthoniobacter sp.]|nr:hypothetical protein [Chthoniobacter sp.]